MKRQLILSEISQNGETAEQIDLYNDVGIRIVSADGIGFSSEISSMQLYDRDGSMYQNSILPQRGISLVVRYIGAKWKHERSKLRLNSLLDSKKELRLRYVTDNIDLYIQCRTEQVNTPPNTYPMVTQISLICPDPYWRKSGDNSVVIAGLIPLFEFIIGIPANGMEFGEIRSGRITDLYNGGTIESGALFTITANQPCTNPKLLNLRTEQFIQISIAMDAGDVLEICTEQGKRSVWFTHNGVRRNYFSRRTKGSEFFQLVCGNNPIKYSVDSGDDRAVDIVCKFDTKYGGI
ncbi:MAG: phage tail family protein [Oscillospiraceae bacterium]|nr:phage tail family protein [Oscillospiraceae bacterium]